jgi:transposase
MLTQGEDVEVHALARRGWSVSAIARHLGRDRKTVRAYLTGQRQPGRRAAARPDPLVPFAAYLSARFADDPHIWATALARSQAGLRTPVPASWSGLESADGSWKCQMIAAGLSR